MKVIIHFLVNVLRVDGVKKPIDNLILIELLHKLG